MNMHIQLLRYSSDLERVLRDDGWLLEPEPNASVSASHPEVADEGAARSPLHRLGLLTSSSLRVEFSPPRPRQPAAGRGSSGTR